jgi:hypothetical protein
MSMERTGGARLDAMHRMALTDMRSKRPVLSRCGRMATSPAAHSAPSLPEGLLAGKCRGLRLDDGQIDAAHNLLES